MLRSHGADHPSRSANATSTRACDRRRCDPRRMQSFTPGHRTRAMILEVRHLRILTAIADHGTVSAATKHVYLTQSAISHQLIELEQRLGIHFFHRTPKG